jgi:hypothetical protein
MAHTDHSKIRRTAKVPMEGGLRTQLRNSLSMGDWDNLPTTMPTRAIRRPVIK